MISIKFIGPFREGEGEYEYRFTEYEWARRGEEGIAQSFRWAYAAPLAEAQSFTCVD